MGLVALTFDINLCNGVNVSIPDFLGCSPLSSSSSSSNSFSTIVSSTGLATQGSTTSTATDVLATVTSIESAFTTTSGGPTATFGGNLLVGVCTVPHLASYTESTGAVLEYPWIGCSNENPGCCPFPLSAEGPLASCPNDYMTTAGACCPT